ncbi:hypothetical protein RJI07_04100 [Mycoplasmatota bacterium WC30]
MKHVFVTFLILIGSVFLIACDSENGDTGLYNEGVYYAVDPQTHMSAHIVVNDMGFIENVIFDQPYKLSTLNTLGDNYELVSGHSWKDEATYLAAYLVYNQGWEDIVLDVTDITGMNTVNVPDYFAEINYGASNDDLDYITIPVDGFVLSWNLAIAEASNSNVGVVTDVPTSEEWLEANQPPYEYIDGIYYGADEDHGYIVRVVVENGFIIDVVFDAITAVNTRIVWNNNGTPSDESDDFPQVELVSMTTKQALQDGLVLISGTPWHLEAELMKFAILDKQTWDPNWLFSVAGAHEYFNFTDSVTIDGVAGVTLAIEGFRSTFEEAIAKAIPNS